MTIWVITLFVDNKDEAADNPSELQHTDINVKEETVDKHVDNEELLENKSNEDSDSSEDDDDQKFPDTQIKIQHSEGTKCVIIISVLLVIKK